MRGGAFVSTLNYVVAAASSGLKVAIFHWRRYSLSAATPLQPRLLDAALAHGVDILSPTDVVSCDVVLFGYPAILAHQVEPFPKIQTEHVLVVINQFANRLVTGEDPQYDPVEARQRLRSLFGMEGIWIPISAWVKRLMAADPRYPTPYERPWNPMIDVDAWCQRPPQWRGAERKRPVVGRHGRDSYTKWPSTKEALAQAYGVGQAWDVRFLGGAAHAIRMLGTQPENWQVVEFDGMAAQEFLDDLDFYIHYPHEQCMEAFGRAVMEAMARGIPVILPPQFKETFADAAIYAQPSEVAEVIAALWVSQTKYMEMASVAREFVLRNCDLKQFGRRLALVTGMSPLADDRNTPSQSPATRRDVSRRPPLSSDMNPSTNPHAAAPAASRPSKDAYWEKRKDSIYLYAAQAICQKYCPKPLSVIDVGSNRTPTLEWHRATAIRLVSVDLRRPYEATGVESITSDFFAYDPGVPFDLVTCFQVLEHIPDPTPFARKLLEVGRTCIVSVPFKWEKGKCKGHIHDPVDAEKMLGWFGRKPKYQYIATELNKVKRLIQVY